ncbi:helix-turn-helix transcriptional regulator [Mycolicibacterium monacense]|uniref:Putative GAF sensor protein n=1 Tax=Mycobacterium sp. (strain JLS) TaxID=164757 RepID=A0A5Q5CM39_MYCSJ|nr:LuxR C-terminal-related transcriptional regulator [Mycolicibacterium monacense]MDA4101537.1 LuxR family transcriptional regulator [Mycolicibacterium monacense DSM 44395]OBB63996.1 helix-turn-helix transcriptional regulator [Mycolicibacterium monacense]OBF47655.1 helix-turn-helix transcriptional regulator [Mycolicibacterium monacense]ORB20549.1 helix-turn-helix transcriptional regulator [Mycolicibacterium monacense DSM 44395]QHP88179.1 LuxR family transcriptional regulator [Mycolicibacterium
MLSVRPSVPSLLRPRDADALRAELRRIASMTGLPVTFGGEVFDRTLLLTEFVGARTSGLRGLAVRPNSGLGGATVVAGRPRSVADYRRDLTITHDYDGPVLGEGIHSVLAVPVVVDGEARAVLYGAQRSPSPIADQTADFIVASARRLSAELRIRDEVDRRLRLREAALAGAGAGLAGTEEVREVHAELRRLAADSPDGAKLRELADRLAHALGGDAPAVETPLSGRELDVLTQVAMGCTNAEAAQRLSLRPETVKSYLRSASAKLGTRTRHESVSRARLLRLIP